ncbi:methionine biosynthesis protein MetW [Salinisphaera sp. USBA-960]|uniref:methionine biosynthesis protein MetW n=1 Tax=Salinisphaera orenii TaxID=856731 RepID=UPI000DBE3163|nr:methionine biosynthesis protein MetW [Salifodinibacter halophilus]NNC26959.1 methionine biosynthesis protein MetW [Salifodinibacter halophilus]
MNTETTPAPDGLRADLALIADWIRPGARVLDLGCGDGALLAHLAGTKDVVGYGLEINADNVIQCAKRGVNVLQLDLDKGLGEFSAASFDYVVMSSALQEVQRPDRLMDEMLRVGQASIVTFPNFGHWRPRLSLGAFGLMPMSKSLPHRWYESPNIRLSTVRDFEQLCVEKGVAIARRHVVNHAHRSNALIRMWPNLFGEIALYQLAESA